MVNSLGQHRYPSLPKDYKTLAKTPDITSLKVKKNQLVKKTLLDNFVEFFSPKRRDTNKIKLENKIISMIKDVKYDQGLDKKARRIAITEIFKKISVLNDSDFVFKLKEDGLLNTNIENRLSPALKAQRKEKKEAVAERDADRLEQAKLAIRVEKARLGLKLGIAMVANKGATGTVLVRNLKGRHFAVFKPTHPHTPLVTRVINRFKLSAGGQLFYLSRKTDAQSKAEVAAYELDRAFGFGITPSSRFIQINGMEGAFQSFVKPTKEDREASIAEGKTVRLYEAKDFIKQDGDIAIRARVNKKGAVVAQGQKIAKYNESQLNGFQKMAIYDFLIGNLDRHDENWMIRAIKLDRVNTTTPDLSQIKVIDNANSFLCKNPLAAGKVVNQYAWKNLQIAQEPFTPAMRNFIKYELTEDKLDAFIQAMAEHSELSGFISPEMQEHLENRLQVLRNMAAIEGKTPAELGGVVSDADFETYLI